MKKLNAYLLRLRVWNDTAHLGLDPGATTRSAH